MKPSALQLPDFWQATLAPSLGDLQFALRNMIAGLVALYLAFYFDLEQPQWALTTVFIVGQSTSGMVLAKGVYRLVGTLVGAFIMGLLSNGSDLLGISNYVQQVIIGAVIILAVSVDELRKRRT